MTVMSFALNCHCCYYYLNKARLEAHDDMMVPGIAIKFLPDPGNVL